MDEFDKLSIYIDWWITDRINRELFKHLNNNNKINECQISFHHFCNGISRHTNKTFLNEWMWKFPNILNN